MAKEVVVECNEPPLTDGSKSLEKPKIGFQTKVRWFVLVDIRFGAGWTIDPTGK